MHLLTLLLTTLLLSYVAANDQTNDEIGVDPRHAHEDNKAGIVAHAIHSIECQLYNRWKLDGVPLLSQDLSTSDNKLITSGSKCLWTSKYSDWRFNYLDYIMKKLDDKNADMGEYSKTERMLHFIHMVNVWERIDDKLQHQWCIKCFYEAKLNTHKVENMLMMIHHTIKNQQNFTDKTKVQSNSAYWAVDFYNFKYKGGANVKIPETFPRITDYPSWVPWGDAMASIADDEIELVARELYTFSHLITYEQIIIYALLSLMILLSISVFTHFLRVITKRVMIKYDQV